MGRPTPTVVTRLAPVSGKASPKVVELGPAKACNCNFLSISCSCALAINASVAFATEAIANTQITKRGRNRDLLKQKVPDSRGVVCGVRL